MVANAPPPVTGRKDPPGNMNKNAKDELFTSDLSLYPSFHRVENIPEVEQANISSFLLLITCKMCSCY